MGADPFVQFAFGKDAKAAFAAAVEQAEYSYGHAGYTGTIAEKGEFVLIDKCLNADVARALAEEMADDDRVSDKWGPAGCIEVEEAVCPNLRPPQKGDRLFCFFGWASS